MALNFYHLCVLMRKVISHSHMTLAETVSSWFLLNLKVVQVAGNILYKFEDIDLRFSLSFSL